MILALACLMTATAPPIVLAATAATSKRARLRGAAAPILDRVAIGGVPGHYPFDNGPGPAPAGHGDGLAHRPPDPAPTTGSLPDPARAAREEAWAAAYAEFQRRIG